MFNMLSADKADCFACMHSEASNYLLLPEAKDSKQACHAATAALWESRSEEMTLEYTDGDKLNHMHKVVCLLKAIQSSCRYLHILA